MGPLKPPRTESRMPRGWRREPLSGFRDVSRLLNRGEGSNSKVFRCCVKNDEFVCCGMEFGTKNLVSGRQVEKESFCSLKMHAAHTTSQHPNTPTESKLRGSVLCSQWGVFSPLSCYPTSCHENSRIGVLGTPSYLDMDLC